MHDFWEDALKSIGFNLWAGVAGFFGGLLALMFDPRRKSTWHSVANVAAGAVAAGYSSDLLNSLIGLKVSLSAGMGFAIGLFGMALADKIIDYIAESKLEDIIERLDVFGRFFKNRKK